MRHYRFAPLQELLRLFFPAICYGCGQPLEGDEQSLCVHCMSHLPLARNAAIVDNATELRLMGRVHFDAAASYMYFKQGLVSQRIVHAIKYRGDEALGLRMGLLMGRDLAQCGRFDSVDCLVPVPLHRSKLWQRGYNQSLLLCQGIAKTFPRPIVADALVRVIATDTQTDKDRIGRMDNIHKAFMVRNVSALQGRHVLLVDDVLTTGATLSECADVVLALPDTKVSIATLTLANG
ncbi:MAG: ComF family protein [Bacteroidales bacterium]|nr:ComF family protein [Bacteroidales bacterium]